MESVDWKIKVHAFLVIKGTQHIVVICLLWKLWSNIYGFGCTFDNLN